MARCFPKNNILFLNYKKVLGNEIYINIKISASFISYFILKLNNNILKLKFELNFEIRFDFILRVTLSGF